MLYVYVAQMVPKILQRLYNFLFFNFYDFVKIANLLDKIVKPKNICCISKTSMGIEMYNTSFQSLKKIILTNLIAI